MKSYGHVNMQQNYVQNMALELVSSFPTYPVVGQLLFKDKILYICAELTAGLPVWIPLTNEINTYIHAQGIPAATWTVNHNLNTTNPLVQIYEASSGAMIIPGNITPTSNNSLSIEFGVAVDGRAIIMIGNQEGLSRPIYSYTHYQNTSALTWVINHGLGYNPIIRVFVGNEEVQPSSIVFTSPTVATITFIDPYAGVAQCI